MGVNPLPPWNTEFVGAGGYEIPSTKNLGYVGQLGGSMLDVRCSFYFPTKVHNFPIDPLYPFHYNRLDYLEKQGFRTVF
jgi:hypothetical protein